MSGEDTLNRKVNMNDSLFLLFSMTKCNNNKLFKASSLGFLRDLAQGDCPTDTLYMLGELVFRLAILA